MKNNSITWAQENRLKAIETLAYWMGRVNTRALMTRFDISRMIAQSDISRYLEMAPGNLSYDRTVKAYLTTSIFKPILTKGLISDYISLEAQANISICYDSITQIQPPSFNLDPVIIRPVITAIQYTQGINVYYRSLNQPEGVPRKIYPHTLVNSGFRWHVRAFCAERNDFRDFNLARIASSTFLTEPRPDHADPVHDKNWQKILKLTIVPNPYLTDAEIALIHHEFSMKKGQLVVETRAALIPYTLQIYQIETDIPYNKQPQRYRLVLNNIDDVKEYLW